MSDEPEPTLELSPEAERDLDLHITWLAERDPQAATRLAGDLLKFLQDLAEGGLDGAVATLPSGARVRRLFFNPFHIYYQRQPGRVLRVVRLYHHRRDPIT